MVAFSNLREVAGVSEEIGAFLRQTRRQVGLSLEEVQERTKIQISFLEAIENGEFHKLPSPFYVRTYLRSYANCLKIEPQHILRQYRKLDQEERLHYGMQATNPSHRVGPGSSLAGHYRSHSDMSKIREKNKNKRLDPKKAMIVSSKSLAYAKSNLNGSKNATTRFNAFQTQKFNALFNEQTNQEAAAAREEAFRKDLLNQKSSPSLNHRMRTEKRLGHTSQLNVTQINRAVNQQSRSSLDRGSTDIFPAVRGNHSLSESSSSSFQRKKAGTNPRMFSATGPIKSPPETESRSDDSLFPARGGRTKGPQKNTGKRNSVLFIALAVICIPLLALGYVLFGTDDGETSQQQKQPQQNVTENKTSSNTLTGENNTSTEQSTVKLVPSETLANTYYLEGGKELDIMIEADGEEVWVGISNKESKKNLIKDLIIKPDEDPFEMVHLFEDTNSLYIYLGRPHSTKVSINNESIESASVIKIKKR
jgi:cytoskeletal protein RodZ